MKRTIGVVLVLTVGAVTAALLYQSASRERQYRALIARGDASLGVEQTFGAIEAYSGAIALRPDSTLAHLRLAEIYERRGNLEEAAREFRRAATLDPIAVRPLEELGDVLYRQQRFDRAADAYGRALRLDDRSARVGYKLALAQYAQGAVDQALRAVTLSLALEPRSADGSYLMGLCLRDRHRDADALRAFEQAAAIAPAMLPVHEELADLYASVGRSADEIDQLQTLAALDRGHVERAVALGLAHHRAGHDDLAVLTLGQALERSPDDPSLYGALGQIWLDRAKDDRALVRKAREALERAATRPEAASATLTAYARALVLDGDLDEAERVLQQATTRFPVELDAFLQYAAVLERHNRPELARRALVQYDALVADDADLPARAARIAALSLRVNDPATAREWLRRGLDRDAHNARLLALERRVGQP